MTTMHWVRLVRIADRAPVYMDRTVEVIGRNQYVMWQLGMGADGVL